MVIASFTNVNVEYEVVIQDGLAVSCQCADHTYRHRTCRHMTVANASIMAEIEKAASFLSVKAQIEKKEREARETAESYMRIFNSPW
jgi:hypothetical protein